MRPTTFDSETLRRHLRRHKIADLPELKSVLGTRTDVTVFRKLKPLDALTSYTHRGRFYTLREIAQFDERGLWSHQSVWFSRQGTLLATVEACVRASSRGYRAGELAEFLHAEVHEPLRHLVQQQRLARTAVDGEFLYTAIEPADRRKQTLARRSAEVVRGVVHAELLEVSFDELKAAILLFYSLLDEQQRRLFAGLESMRAGHGGDQQLAEFLGVDPHTVARGRQQLLDQDVIVGRTRHSGGGRPRQEKKRQK
jgi:hypothetical protein